MSVPSLLARNYAHALFAVYPFNKEERHALSLLAHAVTNNKIITDYLLLTRNKPELVTNVLVSFLTNRPINGHILTQLIMQDITDILSSITTLLARHRQSLLLGEVLTALVNEYDRAHNNIECHITSAYTLDQEQKSSLEHLLHQYYTNIASISYHRDERLIAGMRIYLTNGLLWEHSVAQQLKSLKRTLREICRGT